MEKIDDYYIGLDIGTSSVGWAVSDEKYNIPKFNGKKMWGVRLFDEAKTAEDRRSYRCARRRLNRQKERLKLLDDLFAEEINRIDKNFFIRLKNSDLYREDKDKELKSKFTLFNDKDFTDKHYHQKYPTIHHLIMDLIEDDSKKDIRLCYLACHYLLKNRGHFLFENKDMKSEISLENLLDKLKEYLDNEYSIKLEIDNNEVIEIIANSNLNKTEKKKALKDILGKDKFLNSIFEVIIGSKVNLKEIFDDEDLEDSINFSSADFEKNYSEYVDALGERIDLLIILKQIYDGSILHGLLKKASVSPDGKRYISSVFVEKYKKHSEDLKKTKKFFKELKNIDENQFKDYYFNIFRNDKEENNYVNYVKSTITNNKRSISSSKGINNSEFVKYLKNIMEDIKNYCENNDKLNNNDKDKLNEQIKQIDEMLDNNDFLPKLKGPNNSVIPYQLKLKELEKILNNQAKYYDFLNKKDEYGDVKDKIISIMTFKIPYYVGPLNKDSNYAWIKRSGGQIKPWNFKEIVDLEASREEFIDRLVGRCTYLKNEVVLPKSTLLYTEFMVLNVINKLKINTKPISVDLKKKIYNQLFKKVKKVTFEKIKNLIKVEENELSEIVLTGIDDDLKQGLTAYLDFKNIIGDKVNEEAYSRKIDDIIKLIVLYEDDKKALKNKLKAIYGDYFTSEEIKKIVKLSYKDWGRLSKKFLVGIKGINKKTGEVGNIMHFMREHNYNLMELLSSGFTFLEEIEKLNPQEESDFSYDIVDNLYLSPAVKRMVWQSLKIVEEIKTIIGKDPKKIFIEMARGKEKNPKQKKSRKDKLEKFYNELNKNFLKDIGLEEETYNKLYEKLKSTNESEFRLDRLYLYYTQLGRCMYSLKNIEIDNLYNFNIYDIDHIYPKSKIYDDSMENKVLVLKNKNMVKGDKYPIPGDVLNEKCFSFWKMLYDKKLIGDKKYSHLIRKTPFTDEEKIEFIERQIVETRQATKEVANLLKSLCKNSEIVYSKAENVSYFRNKFGIIKCRSVNDLHHMHDAYLNIVVGNVYNTKFTKDARYFVLNELKKEDYDFLEIFNYDVERAGYKAWATKGNDKTIDKVKNEIKGTNFRFTNMLYIDKGNLYDQQLLRKGKGQISQKENSPKSDIAKYGGYNKAGIAYFCLVESKVKNKKKKSLEAIPLLVYNRLKAGDKNAIVNYLQNDLKLKEAKILNKMIKKNSLFKIDGFYYNITGKTGDRNLMCPAVQLLLDNERQKIVKKIEKIEKNNQENNFNKGKITDEEFNDLYDVLSDKLQNSIYKYRCNNKATNIENGKVKFEDLSYEDKAEVIKQMLLIFQNINNGVDLTKLGYAKAKISCKSSFSKWVSNLKEFKLINQSITGLFENEVDLLKL